MYVQLGKREAWNDVVDELIECHGRIRKFLGFATRLAATPGVPCEEVRTVAAQIHRYFRVAFPLHVLDEEELIAPALAGVVDDALATMHREHADHAGSISRLVELTGELEHAPERLGELAEELAAVAARLTGDVEAHLALEERTVFPALRALPDAREMRSGARCAIAAISCSDTSSFARAGSRRGRDRFRGGDRAAPRTCAGSASTALRMQNSAGSRSRAATARARPLRGVRTPGT